jgi:NADH:ubiquinone reductase (H+-translocating)
MGNAVNASTAGSSGQIVVAGAGYTGLHVALRLAAKLHNHSKMELTLVDRHDYHQAVTELPRVAGGTRAADAVRIPLQDMLAERVRFVQAEITGFDLPGRQLLTAAGPVSWSRLVLALGSRPNDFAIPGLAERTLPVYSASDAERVWAAVSTALTAAAAATDPERPPQLTGKATRILSDLGSRSAPTRRSPPRLRRASGSPTASWSRAACSSGRAG